MSKVYCVISCPISTYSGYGGRSRDVVKSLLNLYPDWDIHILSQRWGETRQGYLEDHGEYELISHISNNLVRKPDIWIQITVPNEFQAVGTFNIGMTAGMETTLSDVSWVEGCNRMDLVIASSNHGKASLVESIYKDNRTGRIIKVEKPVEVLFEGVDLDKYFSIKRPKSFVNITNPWNFLCTGHWMKGNFGEDRKNIGYTIKAFLEAFKDMDPAPGLILKISQGTSSITDREEILKRIYSIQESVQYSTSLPDIYFLHGDLTDEEMNNLYNDPKVRCLVSFTKGEGYGRPLAEFAAVGKPILCSGWSGQLDFLDKDLSVLVGGTLQKVHSSAAVPNMILTEASWFRPDDAQAIKGFQEIFKRTKFFDEKAKIEQKRIKTNFSLEKMQSTLGTVLDKYLPEFPEELELNLPDLENFIDK